MTISLDDLKHSWETLKGSAPYNYDTEKSNNMPFYITIEDLEHKEKYDKVYRIWDNTINDWHRSNQRSIWLSLSGVKTAIGYARNNQFGKLVLGESRYQIKIFNLVPEE